MSCFLQSHNKIVFLFDQKSIILKAVISCDEYFGQNAIWKPMKVVNFMWVWIPSYVKLDLNHTTITEM